MGLVERFVRAVFRWSSRRKRDALERDMANDPEMVRYRTELGRLSADIDKHLLEYAERVVNNPNWVKLSQDLGIESFNPVGEAIEQVRRQNPQGTGESTEDYGKRIAPIRERLIREKVLGTDKKGPDEAE